MYAKPREPPGRAVKVIHEVYPRRSIRGGLSTKCYLEPHATGI